MFNRRFRFDLGMAATVLITTDRDTKPVESSNLRFRRPRAAASRTGRAVLNGFLDGLIHFLDGEKRSDFGPY
jgi:hypothetical protein